jgi:hypothetical protein
MIDLINTVPPYGCLTFLGVDGALMGHLQVTPQRKSA